MLLAVGRAFERWYVEPGTGKFTSMYSAAVKKSSVALFSLKSMACDRAFSRAMSNMHEYLLNVALGSLWKLIESLAGRGAGTGVLRHSIYALPHFCNLRSSSGFVSNFSSCSNLTTWLLKIRPPGSRAPMSNFNPACSALLAPRIMV